MGDQRYKVGELVRAHVWREDVEHRIITRVVDIDSSVLFGHEVIVEWSGGKSLQDRIIISTEVVDRASCYDPRHYGYVIDRISNEH